MVAECKRQRVFTSDYHNQFLYKIYMNKITAVLGASANEERYSNMAIKNLLQGSHGVVCISPKAIDIDGCKGYSSLSEVPSEIDTVTVYIGKKNQSELLDSLILAKPRRVIFNPGTENPEIYGELEKHQIEVNEACTLVMLSINQY